MDLTPDLAERLATLQLFERDMPGAVRGTLVGVNVSRGNRASLRLPTRRVVRVTFPFAVREAMRDALLGEVELSGTVCQDGDGRVFKVRAGEVRVLAEPTLGWPTCTASTRAIPVGCLRMAGGQPWRGLMMFAARCSPRRRCSAW